MKNVANAFNTSICFITFVWQVFEEYPELDAQRPLEGKSNM